MYHIGNKKLSKTYKTPEFILNASLERQRKSRFTKSIYKTMQQKTTEILVEHKEDEFKIRRNSEIVLIFHNIEILILITNIYVQDTSFITYIISPRI